MIVYNSVKTYYTDYSKSYAKPGTFYAAEKKPISVVLKPTLSCNAGCTHCVSRAKKFGGTRRLTLDEYKMLIQKLASMGTERICLSGGEPLIYKDIIPLTRIITENGMIASLNTNGWLLTKDVFHKLMEAGLTCLNVSIDSPVPETHDRLRNFPGLFNRTTRQLEECRASGIPFLLNLRMVLSRYNYRDIFGMICLAGRMHADILSIDLIEADAENNLFLLRENEIEELKNRLVPQIIRQIREMNLKPQLESFNILQLSHMFPTELNTMENYASGRYWPDWNIKNKCDIPDSFMIIEGDGSVLPCNAVEYCRSKIVGNLFDKDIEELWFSSEWDCFRRDKMDSCRECPMNMSHMLVFSDKGVVHSTTGKNICSADIKKTIMLDPTKDYEQERREEFLCFFHKDPSFICEIDKRYPISSLTYKLDFLYANYFTKTSTREELFRDYQDAAVYYSLRQLLGRPDKFEPQLKIFDFITHHFGSKARVLDYGCCIGDFSILFARMGYEVWAVDLDNPTLRFAESRFASRHLNIHVFALNEQMTIPDLPGDFDFIFCRDVLEHILDPLEILTMFWEQLCHEGFLYLSTMNPGDIIYAGGEHIQSTIAMAGTREYRNFFESNFFYTGQRGLYKKKCHEEQ